MTTTDRSPGWYRFGLFEVDERRGEIRKQGSRLRLRGRPFDILLILLERPGELVSRDDLRSRLWPADTFVDFDHGVNTSVNRLREVLGDSAENPRFIETVPRKGYRFIAPVDVLSIRDPLPASAELHAVLPDPGPMPSSVGPAPEGESGRPGSDPFGTNLVPRRRWLMPVAAAAIAVLRSPPGSSFPAWSPLRPHRCDLRSCPLRI